MRGDARGLACALAVVMALMALMALPPGQTAAGEPAGAGEPAAGEPLVEHAALVAVSHESDANRTRVTIHATGPIDYRGGRLHGNQVILDIANIEMTLPSPVVELHTPEVVRMVIGPELSVNGERLLKVRLTGVKARTHKITVKGNDLYIDLIPKNGAREPKGLPKLIRNDSEIIT